MDKTFMKGMGVLEALAHSGTPRGITELSAELELTKSNVHRLLQTLLMMGYVRKEAQSSRYETTLKLWELGALVLGRVDVKQVAAPHLQSLAERTRETVNLSILERGEVVYVDKIDSPQPVRAHSRVGGRAPAHCSSTGKAMLAFRGAEALAELSPTLRRMSDNKIVSRASLEHELAEIRRLGYAMNQGEMTKTVWGVAAPIFGAAGQVIAAVGVAGPAERMRKPTLVKLAPIVRETSLRISSELGYAKDQI